MRSFVATLLIVASAGAATGNELEKRSWDFEDTDVGALPTGWTTTKTGEGEGSVWKVVADESSPGGARVLAQVAAGPRSLFNLCVADGPALRDLELSVAFQAVKGRIDQGGGLVWRYADAKNYYIARFNPLEENFRLYKVVDGERVQLATQENLKAPAGKWHTLSVKMQGEKIDCSLNGKPHLEANDVTITKAGKFGLWTKADAHTYFDQLAAKPLE